VTTVADLMALALDASPPDDFEPAVESRELPEHRTLLAAARAGSQEAFGELVTVHERAVFRAALAALGSREDAEDAAQEAFVLAWRKLAGFRGDSSFRTWLLTIVWRKSLDRRRSRMLWWKRSAPATWLSPDEMLDDLSTAAPDPERALIASDLASVVRREIAVLSPTLRDTLLLAASGEHSYQDIASMLRVPLGTVKWRVSEARRLVSRRIEERHGQRGTRA
jgi:RNA polymerase sigma-70 factor (ECF subfamily)